MIKEQFEFPGSDAELFSLLRQDFEDRVEAFDFGLPIVDQGRLWYISASPSAERRREKNTIRRIVYYAYSISDKAPDLHVASEEISGEKVDFLILGDLGEYPRDEHGIVLELGIAVNNTLPVKVTANSIFHEELTELLTMLKVAGVNQLAIPARHNQDDPIPTPHSGSDAEWILLFEWQDRHKDKFPTAKDLAPIVARSEKYVQNKRSLLKPRNPRT